MARPHRYKRYRQRYVDLIVNPAWKPSAARAQITSGIRRYPEQLGFIGETPVLQSEAGGADALRYVPQYPGDELYLRIATELHLKRLIVGGFEKVFELGRIFRNEGISTRHNP